jgi:predicted RNase H-like nuclease (RuvC/YqgF family)
VKHGGRVLVICWALLLSLLLSGCGGYSESYVEDMRRDIEKLKEENAELEYRIEELYAELAGDIEDAIWGLIDPDDLIHELEEVNGSYDARQLADTEYRQAINALSDLYMKYVG